MVMMQKGNSCNKVGSCLSEYNLRFINDAETFEQSKLQISI